MTSAPLSRRWPHRRASLLGVLLLSLALAGSTLSARVAAHDEFRFVGPVVRMDAAKGVLTMTTKEEGKDVTLQIAFTRATTIEKDGKSVARADLKRGVYIVMDALGDDYDSLEAVKIKIVPPPARSSK